MKLIETLREGDHVADVYLCKTRQQATSKTGKEYENVTLQDCSGMIDCKIWEPNSTGIEEFGPFDYIYPSHCKESVAQGIDRQVF